MQGEENYRSEYVQKKLVTKKGKRVTDITPCIMSSGIPIGCCKLINKTLWREVERNGALQILCRCGKFQRKLR